MAIVMKPGIQPREPEAEGARELCSFSGDVFSDVYARYAASVFRQALGYLRHREDAEDVMQETFARAYLARASYRGDASMNTWLYCICANLCLDRLRWRARHSSLQERHYACEILESPAEDDSVAFLDHAPTLAAIRLALKGLPRVQRELLYTHVIEERSIVELSRQFGCSAGTMRVRLCRARRTLQMRVQAILSSERIV